MFELQYLSIRHVRQRKGQTHKRANRVRNMAGLCGKFLTKI